MRQWLEQNSNKDAQGAGIALKSITSTKAGKASKGIINKGHAPSNDDGL